MTPKSPHDRKRTRRRAAWMAIAVLGTLGLALALFLGAPRPEVEVADVTRGTYVRYIEEDGRARVRDRYVVSAPLAGTLERLTLRVGDRVAPGDVVAILRPAPSPLLDARSRAEMEERRGAAEARLAAARAAQSRADAARAQAENEVARARQLAEAGALPGRDLERSELALTVAEHDRDAARSAAHLATHDLEQARAALRSATHDGSVDGFQLNAPVDGRVLRVRQESESMLAPGTPILELGDPAALEVVVDLLSTDAVRVEPGAEAEITGWGGEGSLRARVRMIEPVANVRVSALGVEEERVDVIVDPIDPDDRWARIGDGYRVEVRVPIERIENALRIPTSALFRVGEEWRAFVVEDEVVQTVAVVVTSYGPLESVVTSGVEEGDTVVLQPPEALRDGDGVAVRRASSL